jgi:uncharacterized protein YdeI (YjbR/CyaY-like superfamily)
MSLQLQPIFFETAADFRNWFAQNHQNATELLVGFYKVGSGKPSMTWSESVDQAICFGWIDGIRKSVDEMSYTIRFTPRKPNSIWSAVNIKKVEVLTEQGLMQPAGIARFELKKESNSKIYAYEMDEMRFSPEMEQQFKENALAWDYFQKLAPSYRKTAIHWVMTAKQDITKIKRLNELIADSEASKNRWKS